MIPPETMEKRRGPGARWLIERIGHEGDECLTWPFATYPNGYGAVRFDGGQKVASRVMCILVHGEPPDPTLEAAHSCGNGHLGCVNPKHIRWRTQSQNTIERRDHGTDNRGVKHANAKLTDDDVRKIRALRGSLTQRKLAAMFGVSPERVCHIQARNEWKHVE